jgi:hypothetical protein
VKIYVTFHPASVVEGGFHFKHKQLAAPHSRFPRRGTKLLGFDTEYGAKGDLLTVGLADGRSARAIECSDPKWKGACNPIVRSSRILVGHSLAGDIDYLVKHGLAKESWVRGSDQLDSLLLARMVDENRGKGGYGLEPLMLSEFNFGSWKQPTADLLKKDPDASKWPVKLRTARCRIDAWATRILAEHFRTKLLEEM